MGEHVAARPLLREPLDAVRAGDDGSRLHDLLADRRSRCSSTRCGSASPAPTTCRPSSTAKWNEARAAWSRPVGVELGPCRNRQRRLRPMEGGRTRPARSRAAQARRRRARIRRIPRQRPPRQGPRGVRSLHGRAPREAAVSGDPFSPCGRRRRGAPRRMRGRAARRGSFSFARVASAFSEAPTAQTPHPTDFVGHPRVLARGRALPPQAGLAEFTHH